VPGPIFVGAGIRPDFAQRQIVEGVVSRRVASELAETQMLCSGGTAGVVVSFMLVLLERE
jgi:hypothetical protein